MESDTSKAMLLSSLATTPLQASSNPSIINPSSVAHTKCNTLLSSSGASDVRHDGINPVTNLTGATETSDVSPSDVVNVTTSTSRIHHSTSTLGD